MYCEAVHQYIEDGHVWPIDEDHKADKIRYLPHHGVPRSVESCLIVVPKRMMDNLSTPVFLKVPNFSQILDMF